MTSSSTSSAETAGHSVSPLSPGCRPEITNLIIHFYRGEIARATGWRDRLDRTTNWAITAEAAMLSIALSSATSRHEVLLFGMVVCFLLLVIEARRYRYFDVYRRRVRVLERNYFAAVFAEETYSDSQWAHQLAMDLRHPTFLMSRSEAIARRLKRNYIWIFLILLFAWLLKLSTFFVSNATEVHFSFAGWASRASIGSVQGGYVLATVMTFYGFILIWTIFSSKKMDGELSHGSVHV